METADAQPSQARLPGLGEPLPALSGGCIYMDYNATTPVFPEVTCTPNSFISLQVNAWIVAPRDASFTGPQKPLPPTRPNPSLQKPSRCFFYVLSNR